MSSYNGKRKATLTPCTAGSTAETISLYSYLQSLSGTSGWCVGVADYYRIGTYSPRWTNYQGMFQQMTGKLPAMLTLEYVDVLDPLQGAAKSANMRADILEIYRTGGFVALQHHTPNPVTYGFTATSDAVTVADRAGSPATACLSGGAQRTNFLAYCDRVSAFLNSLVLDGRKCPVIVRWFHEINGDFFWWNGADRRTACIQMYKDFIDRLRSNGVTNALYALNFEVSVPNADLATWYLGDAYVDFVTGDFYVQDAAPVFPAPGPRGLQNAGEYSSMLALGKPFYWAEVGCRFAPNSPPFWRKNIGGAMLNYPAASIMTMWMPWDAAGNTVAWAPWPGGGADEALAEMVADPRCITRDRVSWQF